MAETKKRKTITGKVTKLSSASTVKVEVESKYPHPRFSKIVKHHTSYNVHVNEGLTINLGDSVKFSECKPVSKLKKWVIVEVLNK